MICKLSHTNWDSLITIWFQRYKRKVLERRKGISTYPIFYIIGVVEGSMFSDCAYLSLNDITTVFIMNVIEWHGDETSVFALNCDFGVISE